MKSFHYLLLLLLVALSCKEEPDMKPDMPESVYINLEDAVFLGNGTESFVEMTLNPADYNLTAGQSSVSLEVMESNISWFQGKSPIFYSLTEIKSVNNAPGQYKVGIRDLGKGEKYSDKVRIVIKTLTEEGTKVIRSNEFTLMFAGNSISSLAFLRRENPASVIKDIHIDKNSGSVTISSPLITKPELILSYKTDAAKVLVGDVEQVSGKTVNDFSKPVTYSFVSAAGEIEQLTINVVHSGLPVVFINTPAGLEIPPKTEDWLEDSHITIYNSECSIVHSGTTSIRGRGNSTWKYPKKPYALKLDSKAEILGMPKHKRWVLLANWLDRTLLRNHVSFHIAKQTGLDWTPRGEFVEVFLNDKHIGNYYLCEHIKVDENRVNISELEENDIDGGFMMELDTYYDEPFKFKSTIKKFPYMFKDPDEVNDKQFAFMQSFIDTLENCLCDQSRLLSREYEQYLDIDSFVDWWITYELTGNTETKHPKSTYVHRDKGGKLKAGPVWDFDWKSFRLNNEEWVTKNHLYYPELFKDPVFVARVKERWSLHEERLSKIPEFIETEAARITNSEGFNHQMWPITQNTNEDIDLSFIEAVQRMKRSYEAKFNFMKQNISRL